MALLIIPGIRFFNGEYFGEFDALKPAPFGCQVILPSKVGHPVTGLR